jgi:hypothetical protein
VDVVEEPDLGATLDLAYQDPRLAADALKQSGKRRSSAIHELDQLVVLFLKLNPSIR